MKVIIGLGGDVHDPKEELLTFILDEHDRFNLVNMLLGDKLYCCYPEEKYTVEEIEAWLKKVKEEIE